MSWLFQLPVTYPLAHAIGILAIVCCAGMALGSLKGGAGAISPGCSARLGRLVRV